MKRVLILVEGYTEEGLVNAVLRPHLERYGIWLTPTILTTKRNKSGPNSKGGVTSYQHAKNDVTRLLMDTDAALVTTLIDFYALPRDFPGWGDKVVPGYRKVFMGPLAIEEIGLEVIRSHCPHFDGWLRRLEALGHGASPQPAP